MSHNSSQRDTGTRQCALGSVCPVKGTTYLILLSFLETGTIVEGKSYGGSQRQLAGEETELTTARPSSLLTMGCRSLWLLVYPTSCSSNTHLAAHLTSVAPSDPRLSIPLPVNLLLEDRCSLSSQLPQWYLAFEDCFGTVAGI